METGRTIPGKSKILTCTPKAEVKVLTAGGLWFIRKSNGYIILGMENTMEAFSIVAIIIMW